VSQLNRSAAVQHFRMATGLDGAFAEAFVGLGLALSARAEESFREARQPLNRVNDKLRALKKKRAQYAEEVPEPKSNDPVIDGFNQEETRLNAEKEQHQDKIELYKKDKGAAAKASQRGVELKGIGVRI